MARWGWDVMKYSVAENKVCVLRDRIVLDVLEGEK